MKWIFCAYDLHEELHVSCSS